MPGWVNRRHSDRKLTSGNCVPCHHPFSSTAGVVLYTGHLPLVQPVSSSRLLASQSLSSSGCGDAPAPQFRSDNRSLAEGIVPKAEDQRSWGWSRGVCREGEKKTSTERGPPFSWSQPACCLPPACGESRIHILHARCSGAPNA